MFLRVTRCLEFEASNCSCGLGPVSLRFVQSLGSGLMLVSGMQESTWVFRNLDYLLCWHMCEMDVCYLEWVQRAVRGGPI